MRILFDHQAFSLQNAGGITRYHFELICHMAARTDVSITTMIGVTGSVLPLEQLSRSNVMVRAMRVKLGPGLVRYAINETISNFAAPILGKQDVYHSTYYRFVPTVRCKKRIATHHDCVQERFPNLFPDADRIFRHKHRLFASADAIVCVSEASRRDLLQFYKVDPGKTRVIHHGLGKLPRCPKAASRIAQAVPRDYILMVGSRAPYKNFNGLLDAYAESGLYRDLDLLLIGGGVLTAGEREQVASLGIFDSVRVVPEASDTLLAEAYCQAKLLVYPSLYEGFGFPPLEAMSFGCPSLVSNSSSLPEVCRDGAIYFDVSQAGSLAHFLKLAIYDSELRQRVIQNGRSVAASYSWDRCGQATLDLYREC